MHEELAKSENGQQNTHAEAARKHSAQNAGNSKEPKAKTDIELGMGFHRTLQRTNTLYIKDPPCDSELVVVVVAGYEKDATT